MPRSSAALSCYDGSPDDYGSGYQFTRPDEAPVAVHPWLLLDCDDAALDCSFVADDHTVPVKAVAINECSSRRREGYLVEFAPQMPLLPGRTYGLECSGGGFFAAHITTRASDAPAAPPEAVALREAWIDRAGDWPCGGGDSLQLEFAELDAPYLWEGGRIEVTYPDGRIFPISIGFTSQTGELPRTTGPLELTPVAADGTRGETVRTDKIDFREAVFVMCSVAPEQSPWTLVVLLPVLGLGLASHRRRGAR